MRKVFQAIDSNSDGKLSYEEILSGYKEYFGSDIDVEEAVLQIFKNIDADKNGFISYDGISDNREFITASVNKPQLLTKSKLEYAFQLFDKNKDGYISAKEVKEVLGKDCSLEDSVWIKIVQEVDLNGDGEVLCLIRYLWKSLSK
jgi:Ca2+-binding EF-hand superfamily protein